MIFSKLDDTWLRERFIAIQQDREITQNADQAYRWIRSQVEHRIELQILDELSLDMDTLTAYKEWMRTEQEPLPEFGRIYDCLMTGLPFFGSKKIRLELPEYRKRELAKNRASGLKTAASRQWQLLVDAGCLEFHKQFVSDHTWARLLDGGSATTRDVEAQIINGLNTKFVPKLLSGEEKQPFFTTGDQKKQLEEMRTQFRSMLRYPQLKVPEKFKAELKEKITTDFKTVTAFLDSSGITQKRIRPLIQQKSDSCTSQETMLQLVLGLHDDLPTGGNRLRSVGSFFSSRQDKVVAMCLKNNLYDQIWVYYVLETFRYLPGDRNRETPLYGNLYQDPEMEEELPTIRPDLDLLLRELGCSGSISEEELSGRLEGWKMEQNERDSFLKLVRRLRCDRNGLPSSEDWDLLMRAKWLHDRAGK